MLDGTHRLNRNDDGTGINTVAIDSYENLPIDQQSISGRGLQGAKILTNVRNSINEDS